ncbi:Nucleotide-binding universal stress protein, UspA family [Zobellia uliginosa]|uniref:Nucleotide-binding universal stress protein, UspA family n=1 Tax=Zobellia uliginosa TaxID=143224 RepID=A0ABY1KSB9_9FLAO|nr:universal stress protein [Zobellia uliginosa]SIS63183.1 Nucleotide-binding universal stress protein, UspA family [Zobellia uliginosa]
MLKVLLPTDFSENSKNAIRYALHFYKDVACTFYLLHTYTPAAQRIDYILGSPGQIGLGDTWKVEAESRINELSEALESDDTNLSHRFVTHVAFESLGAEVQKMVLNEQIDIIVMGTQGATGAKATFLGTKTVDVLKEAPCPMLIVPNGCTYQLVNNVAFVTNYKRNFSADILEPIKQVLSRFGASIHIMHIFEEERLNRIQESNRNTLETYLEEFNPSFHWMPNFGNKTKGIQVFLKELEIDLLTMFKYDHDFIEKLTHEPVIKKVSFCVDIPFMVIPVEE